MLFLLLVLATACGQPGCDQRGTGRCTGGSPGNCCLGVSAYGGGSCASGYYNGYLKKTGRGTPPGACVQSYNALGLAGYFCYFDETGNYGYGDMSNSAHACQSGVCASVGTGYITGTATMGPLGICVGGTGYLKFGEYCSAKPFTTDISQTEADSQCEAGLACDISVHKCIPPGLINNRFIKSDSGDRTYFERVAAQTKHYVSSCTMCSPNVPNICDADVRVTVTEEFISSLTTSTSFGCSMLESPTSTPAPTPAPTPEACWLSISGPCTVHGFDMPLLFEDSTFGGPPTTDAEGCQARANSWTDDCGIPVAVSNSIPAPTSLLNGYTHIAHGCVPWHFVSWHNKSVEQCAILCSARPDCLAFEYYGASQACQLQNSSKFINCDGIQNLYVKTSTLLPAIVVDIRVQTTSSAASFEQQKFTDAVISTLAVKGSQIDQSQIGLNLTHFPDLQVSLRPKTQDQGRIIQSVVSSPDLKQELDTQIAAADFATAIIVINVVVVIIHNYENDNQDGQPRSSKSDTPVVAAVSTVIAFACVVALLVVYRNSKYRQSLEEKITAAVVQANARVSVLNPAFEEDNSNNDISFASSAKMPNWKAVRHKLFADQCLNLPHDMKLLLGKKTEGKTRLFVSHATKDDSCKAKENIASAATVINKSVFDPDEFFKTHKPSKQEMAEQAGKHDLTIACLSPKFFKSEYCFAEIQGAAKAGKPIIAVYWGEAYPIDLMKRWVGGDYNAGSEAEMAKAEAKQLRAKATKKTIEKGIAAFKGLKYGQSHRMMSEDKGTKGSSIKTGTSIAKRYYVGEGREKMRALEELRAVLVGTDWWKGFKGGVKKAVEIKCQEDRSVLMICIKGGAITTAEQQEMPTIHLEIEEDLKQQGVVAPIIEVRTFQTVQEFEEFVRGAGKETQSALVVCSAPAKGPDDKGSYEFPVMEHLKNLRAEFPTRLCIAYDWAGSTNAWDGDEAVWKQIFGQKDENTNKDKAVPSKTKKKCGIL